MVWYSSSYETTTTALPQSFDVIVVGTGAAGLYAALCLPESLQVGLVTKDQLQVGASDWAQGGIAAAIAPDDSTIFHLEDTLKAGAGLCDRPSVDFLVNNAATAIHRLVELGVAFDRNGSQLAMTLEAAHSYPRVLHVADTTGRAIVGTLSEQVLKRQNIQVLSQAFALNLWLHPDSKRCQGVSLLHENQIRWLGATAVILATGGGGQVYAQTTNPAVSTGDGIALAWRGGAKLRDLEFVQFHPTALTQPGAPRFLISEAVRGEGAHLVDKKGDRFAFNYDPKGELAPRDVVSRAIFNHLEQTAVDPAQGRVYLDLTPIERDRLRYRFPNIIQVCQHWGIDVFSEPIPVAPAAHYWMGGIATDWQNQTSIPGLYAIGETSNTGVHGANRLASNSLLECLVYAAQLAELEIDRYDPLVGDYPAIQALGDFSQDAETLAEARSQLQRLMWHSAGIIRSDDILTDAIAQVKDWRNSFHQLRITQYVNTLIPGQTICFSTETAQKHLQTAAETLNLFDIAYLILKSALYRTESRGGHFRKDYPQPSPQWQVHTQVEGEDWSTVAVDL
ncbi:MAG: L-aspartate oxidase [Jaaginema sp. PMC 1079.18]|nr:L-aspartate oxidase [Jaaginema sp. PMC 1080.18]MEC4851271.1 L-aspartate oxidase [Jaaginema sp. PMC 1079.18]MEC4868028.1 L-aspartate oxidase [Jaaginema sp. PMC 1078.18]